MIVSVHVNVARLRYLLLWRRLCGAVATISGSGCRARGKASEGGGGRPSVGTGRRSLRGARLARHRALSAGNRARFRETLSAHVLPGSDARQKPRAALGPELVPPSHVTAGVGHSFRLWPCQRRSRDVSRPRLLKTRISRSVKKTFGTRACTEGAMKNGGRMMCIRQKSCAVGTRIP